MSKKRKMSESENKLTKLSDTFQQIIYDFKLLFDEVKNVMLSDNNPSIQVSLNFTTLSKCNMNIGYFSKMIISRFNGKLQCDEEYIRETFSSETNGVDSSLIQMSQLIRPLKNKLNLMNRLLDIENALNEWVVDVNIYFHNGNKSQHMLYQ